MKTRSFIFALGMATACLGGAAFAQGDLARDPDLRSAGTSATPQLNSPAAPASAAPFAGGESATEMAGSQSAMSAPVGPGSGMSVAFQLPGDVSFAMGLNQPQPGEFSLASGPDEADAPERAPAMLGTDLGAVDPGALPAGSMTPPSVRLGQ
jgi:hypothetical protein